MPRRRSLLSDATKVRLAALQGAQNRVQQGYYGDLTSKETGNFVKYSIYLAEQAVSGTQAPPPAPNFHRPD